jgi:hypothetical protein
VIASPCHPAPLSGIPPIGANFLMRPAAASPESSLETGLQPKAGGFAQLVKLLSATGEAPSSTALADATTHPNPATPPTATATPASPQQIARAIINSLIASSQIASSQNSVITPKPPVGAASAQDRPASSALLGSSGRKRSAGAGKSGDRLVPNGPAAGVPAWVAEVPDPLSAALLTAAFPQAAVAPALLLPAPGVLALAPVVGATARDEMGTTGPVPAGFDTTRDTAPQATVAGAGASPAAALGAQAGLKILTPSVVPQTTSLAPLAFAMRLSPMAAVNPTPNAATHAPGPPAYEPSTFSPARLNATSSYSLAVPPPTIQPTNSITGNGAQQKVQGQPATAPSPAARSQAGPNSSHREPSGNDPKPAPETDLKAPAATPGADESVAALSGVSGFAVAAHFATKTDSTLADSRLSASTIGAPDRIRSADPPPQSGALQAGGANPAASQSPAARVPASGIAMRVAPPGAAPVDVQLTDRAGQIHVAVRTQDPALETSLRRDLGALVASLERSGFRAQSVSTGGAAGKDSAFSESRSGTDSGRDRSQGQGGQSPHSGAGNGQQPPRQQQSSSRRQSGPENAFSLTDVKLTDANVSADRFSKDLHSQTQEIPQ